MSGSPRYAEEVRLELARRLLGAGDNCLSGERLAADLGISRAAVSKHLAVLRKRGFSLDASPRRGYRLVAWPDALTPEAVLPRLQTRDLGRALIYREVCESTNTLAFSEGVAGAPHGLTVVADAQTSGRGRRGRDWHSPPTDGLYVSVLLRPRLQPQAAPPLAFAAAVAVAEALEETLDLAPRLKWPNDVLLGERKVCGILLEMSAEPERVAFVVCGIGLNVNAQTLPADIAHRATSLRLELGTPVARPLVLAPLLAALERWVDRYVDEGFAPLREAWLARAAHLDQEVRVQMPDATIHGVAETLDADGALVLRLASGESKRILVGDVWPATDPVDEAPTTR
jgi:BirA family transcriptional regulator, biotin operon repressor / biotin---[acetyl-CoA-carboxylase] ligase